MVQRLFYNTNDKSQRVTFEQALMEGMAPKYGLYTVDPRVVHQFSKKDLQEMKGQPYANIALSVLHLFLKSEINSSDLEGLLQIAYDPSIIPTDVERVTGNTYIMWLTQGPTYSFKDYAARFFGLALDYFLKKSGQQRIVLTATSGDTGGAVGDALDGLQNVSTVIFYPNNDLSCGQRRQMTTLKRGHAVAVNGNFDVCQDIAKNIIEDRDYAMQNFGDPNRLTSANSISVGRLLPQAVYPFFAFSRLDAKEFIPSIPSGNFGDLMGTVIAKSLGLPIPRIVCGVNENKEFPNFLSSGNYVVNPLVKSPSSAMNVTHPSNLARLVDFYGGHMFDEWNEHGKVIRQGVIDVPPNMEEMRRNIFAVSVSDQDHFDTMRTVYAKQQINGQPLFLDPHGAVGWKALEMFLQENYGGQHLPHAVIYETAWVGKFKELIKEVLGVEPIIPQGILEQEKLPERIHFVRSEPDRSGKNETASQEQIEEAKSLIVRLCKQ